jgi:hypothetical protein
VTITNRTDSVLQIRTYHLLATSCDIPLDIDDDHQ